MFLRRYKIRKHERGLKFVDGAFVGVLAEGTHFALMDRCKPIGV